MVGVGGLSGLARFGVRASVAVQRLVPSSANEFFVVAPVIGGAMVYRFIRNNNGDSSTPAASVGAPFQAWRLGGAGWLNNAAGNPASPDFWFSYDVGSQDVAFNYGGIYAGSYHGGEATSANLVLANGASIDPTQAQTGTCFSIQHSSTITWSAGNTASIASYSLTVNPDGSLSETTPFSSSLSFTDAFVSMLIAGDGSANGYTEADLNAEGWTIPLQTGRAILLQHDDVTIRNPVNGRFIRAVANAKAQSGYSRAQFTNTATRSKLYHRFTGVVAPTITRTISFGVGPTGARFSKTNLLSNGDFSSGIANWSVYGGSAYSFASGNLRLTRQTGQDNRIYQGFSTTVGATYLSVTNTLADATTSGAAFAASSAANGSVNTPPAAFNQSMVAGVNMQLWLATQTTHYHMCLQGAGAAGAQADYGACAVYRLS
ncbi:hypothetical protein [Terrarubrum flagellatum]|uniref:hypothetical protein n=1 Tax=Terrirubrum flagellatum TaxID=2895980 RepID=UPI003145247A